MLKTTSRLRPDPPAYLWLLSVVFALPPAMGQTLSIDDVMVVEGDSGTVNAEFTVTISSITPLRVTVDYATADGSATAADSDYLPASGTLTFEGTAPQTFSVPIIGDLKPEPDEMFVVDLSNPIHATIADGQGRGTILDDDPESRVRLAAAPSTIEDAGMAVVTVERVGADVRAARVTVTATSGTAQAGEGERG